MNINYITTEKTVTEVRDAILQAPILGADCETTSLDYIDGKLRLLQIATSAQQAYVFDLFHLNPSADYLQFLRDIFADAGKVKIFHNGKFDLQFLKNKLAVTDVETVFDTMLGSKLLACGDDNVRHNLQAVVARYCKRNIDKTQQKSDWSKLELSDEQIRYGAIDALILQEAYVNIKNALVSADLTRCAYLEFNALESFADLERNGFHLNQQLWLKRIEHLEKEKADFAEKLHKEFIKVSKQQSFFGESDVNLDAPEQVLEALKALGVPLKNSTKNDDMEPLAEKYPVVGDFIQYRSRATSLKMFGRNYFNFINKTTGRIHAQFNQVGTPTGRTRCSEPNLQQLPAETETRGCFTPQQLDGKLIVADYSQIELRIMAEFSGDKVLREAFENDIDLHGLTASRVFKKPFEECHKGTKERRLGKDLNFGTSYKVGAPRFAVMTGLSVSESERLLKEYWKIYSGLNDYMQGCEKRVIEEREIRSFSGRTWRFDFNVKDLKEVGDVERQGRNHPIQGTCSDIMKRALYFLAQKLRKYNGTAKLVNIVHDEIIVECNGADAENVATDLNAAMVSAGQEALQTVPCKVDFQISDKWEK